MKPSGFGWLLPLTLFLISSEALQNDAEHEFKEDEIQRKIDDEIAKYREDVRQMLQKDEKRKLVKRSTSASEINLSKLEEVPRFSSIERLHELPDLFAVDVVLFCLQVEQNEKCFAASLLTSDTENVDQLVLYKLNGDKFTRSDRTEVRNGRSLATHNIAGVQYIVATENRDYSDSNLFASPVFAVDAKSERLQRLYYLGDRHLTDAIIWDQTGTDHIFLATTSATVANATGGQYGDQSHVYRWMGNHFDLTHSFASYNASRITQFTIGGNMFLAVANMGSGYQDGSNLFSAIYMYNLHEERFILHQRLPTATDIKFFTHQLEDETESFLLVSSNVHSPNSDQPCVVIYKLLPESYHFLPLQVLRLEGGADLLLPVVKKDETGLLASVLFAVNRKLGLKVFQYDGWRFVEAENQLNREEFGPGITSMRIFNYRGSNVVTLVNKRSISLIFKVVWKVTDTIKALQSNLETWCDQVLKEEEELETISNNLLHEARLAPKLNESVDIGGCLVFENPTTHIDTIQVANTGMTKPDNEMVKKKFEQVKEDVKKTEETLKDIAAQKEVTFEEPVTLESVDFKCLHGCVFLDLEIGTLNGENLTNFLENSHGLTKKHIDRIEFESLNVTSHTDVDNINDRPVKHLVTSSNNHNERFDVNVNGKVMFDGGLTVYGEVDGVKFDSNLLIDGKDQVFDSKLSVDSLIVDKINVEKSVRNKFEENVRTGNNFISSLDVNELTLVDDKISGVDFGEFIEKTLKKTSVKEQIVQGYHHYKVLTAEEIDDSNFEYKSNDDSNFETKSQNGLKLKNKDVVVDKNRNVEEIDGDSDLKKCFGTECVEDQFRIDGDFEIDGSLLIENGTLFVEDVYLEHENVSFGDLLKNGLRLDSGVICNLVFNAPMYVDNLNVDTVNHIDPNTWVDGCRPGREPIVVTGHKVFTGSLNLEKGGTVAGKINNILYDDLMFDTLKKDGDQDVEGFKHIGKITAKVIESDSLLLKNDKVTGKAKTHSGGDLVVNRMKGTLVKAKTINDVVLADVLNDTLFKDNKTYRVETKTRFVNNLRTNELFCADVSELSNHTNERRMTEHSIPVNNISNSEIVNLTAADVNGKRLTIERLYFTGSLDGISAEDFGNWLLVDGNQTIKSVCQIKNIEAKNGVKLASNLINGVDIDEFVGNLINISEPITLTSVVFEDEIKVENGVKVGGLVNGVEFSEKELVLKGCVDETVTFTGEKVVVGDLEAESLDVDDLKTFCKVFVDPQDGDPQLQLEIVGNVEFSKEPTIKFLNNQNISELFDSLWFVDEDIIVDHDMAFESVVFKGHLNMSPGSELNGMNLTRLSEEYFSLTADQKITKEIIFDKIAADGLTVSGRVEAYDLVAGMRFNEFVNSVMRQKRRQIVTAILNFEDVEVDGVLNVNASGTVNGVDLEKDLMRWNNTVNVVRGKTYLTSLKTQTLEAKPGVLIQGIDISKWKQLAVTNSGHFNISGQKTFESSVYVDKDLRVHGLVNGIKFDQDSVLLTNGDQTITGQYQFGPDTVLEIQNLLLNNLVDGVNMTYLLDQQVCKDDTNLLITGKKTFKSRFTTANQVEMRRHFEDIDLVELYNQLMNPFDGISKDNRLNGLRSIRKDVELSLARRAYLFTAWEKVAEAKGKVRLVLPLVKSMERVVFLGKFTAEGKRMKLSLNNWDARKRMFIETGERRTFMKKPTDASVVETASGESRLFTLFRSSNASVMTGVIYNVSSDGGSLTHISVGTFDTSAANRILYLTDDCFLLWGVAVPQCYIYCSWQRVHSFACSDVNEIIKFTNETATLVLIAKTKGDVEVKSFVENELQNVAEVTVSKQPVLRMDVITQPLSHHFILVACSDTVVTFLRFDSNWQKMDSAALMLQNASARLLSLPTNEIITVVMSSCSRPITYKWAGLSQPQSASLPIGGSEIRQVYQFQDALGVNYTLIVSDRETAVLKALFFVDDLEL